MKYTITPQGIVYTISSEEIAEELATDVIEDAHRPMTQAEAIRVMQQISKEIERLDNVQSSAY